MKSCRILLWTRVLNLPLQIVEGLKGEIWFLIVSIYVIHSAVTGMEASVAMFINSFGHRDLNLHMILLINIVTMMQMHIRSASFYSIIDVTDLLGSYNFSLCNAY